MDHRFEHLGGDDGRPPDDAAGRQDALLQGRHGLGRHLHAEVAARHHDAVALLDDLVEMVDGGGLLELGHHCGAACHQLLQLGDVVGVLHEAQRHPVDAERQPVGQVPVVLGRHRRQRDHEVGQVDTLAVADRAGNLDLGVDRGLVVGGDAQPHLAVVDQQDAVGLGRLEDLRMGQGHALRRTRRLVHVEAQLLASLQRHRPLGEGAQPELGALQVHQNGDGMPVLLLQRAQQVDALAMVVLRAVAEVQAKDVGAGLEQRTQPLAGGRGRPQRGDDLGEAIAMHA